MSGNRYGVVFKKSALKELQALPERIQRKILDAVHLLSINPYTEILQIKKMKGADSLYRVRIQDYRVIFYIESQFIKISIIKIGHRKDIYA